MSNSPSKFFLKHFKRKNWRGGDELLWKNGPGTLVVTLTIHVIPGPGCIVRGPVPSLRGSQGGRAPPTTACAYPFRFTQNTFLEHHVTTKQQTIMEKE